MKKLLLPLILLVFCQQAEAHHIEGSAQSNTTNLIGYGTAGMQNGGAVPGTPGVDYIVPTLSDLQYYHSKNLNIVRLPILWERLQQTLGGSFNSTYVSGIQSVLSNAASLGMTVIIDIHNFGGYCYGAVCGSVGGTGGPTIAQFASMWGQLAATFAGTPGLGGYELMNEPHDMPSASIVPTMYQAAITSIRVSDIVQPIYLDGDAYASAFGWLGNCANCGGPPIGGWAPGGNNDLLALTDPDNNLIFDGHAYGDYNGSGTYPVYPNSVAVGCTAGQSSYQCAEIMGDQLTTPTSVINTNILIKRVNPFVNWCNTNHVKCVIGESGISNDDYGWLQANDNLLAYLQTNNISYWAWLGGPGEGGYNLGIEPTNGIDTVQMAVLAKYTKPTYNLNYTFTGPEYGTANQPSSNFTLTLYGYLANPVTIYLNDNSSGGTFSHSSLTFPAGFNGVSSATTAPAVPILPQTFTYTSSGANVAVLSPNNNGGMTDVSSLGYATVSDQFLANSTSCVNAFSTRKIVAPYLGPAMTLRRGTDNATMTFGYTGTALNSPINNAAILSWAGTQLFSPYPVPVYVVTWYSQCLGENNATIISPNCDGGECPANSDQPQLILNCHNGLDCVSFTGNNRMDILSPITGNTQQSVIAVMAPAFHWGEGFFLGWDWTAGPQNTQYDFQPAGSQNSIQDVWNTTNACCTREYSQDSIWSALSGAMTVNQTDGQINYMNGVLTSKNNTSSGELSLEFNRNNATLGYQRFFSPSWVGNIGELVILNNAMNGTQLSSFQSDEDTAWSIPTFTGFNWPSPTLQQNVSTANAPPWAGVNQAGAVGNFGLNFNAQTPSSGQTYYANRGMNIVRLPVLWEQLQQNLCTGNTTLDPTSLGWLDTAVSTITASKQDILIDLHNFGGYNYSTWSPCASPPDNGQITQTQTGDYFVNFWTQLAARYAGNAKVKFDLMNEPAGQTAASLATIYQTTITAIRGQSFNGYVFTEFGPSFAACSDVTANGGPAFGTLTDSQSKLILECHAYLQQCGNDSCGDYAAQGAALSNLSGATTYCAANGCHLFWGEFNAGFTPSMYSEMTVAFNLMAANPTVWYGWSEYAGGPAWPEQYVGLIEPRDFNTPIADRPQMRILSTYATGGTWPTAGGAWPYNVQFP